MLVCSRPVLDATQGWIVSRDFQGQEADRDDGNNPKWMGRLTFPSALMRCETNDPAGLWCWDCVASLWLHLARIRILRGLLTTQPWTAAAGRWLRPPCYTPRTPDVRVHRADWERMRCAPASTMYEIADTSSIINQNVARDTQTRRELTPNRVSSAAAHLVLFTI